MNRELLEKLYNVHKDSSNLVFNHADKVWVMPECAVKGAMDMYQPSSKGGKLLKKKVVKKHKIPFYIHGSKVRKANIELAKDIRIQLERLLDISDFYVAAYMGDTSTQQNDKAVLQIYSDDEIYAYVKVTTNAENAKRFEKEADAIRKLNSMEIDCIPKLIGTDFVSLADRVIFV